MFLEDLDVENQRGMLLSAAYGTAKVMFMVKCKTTIKLHDQ
jgi:hypothetical protein